MAALSPLKLFSKGISNLKTSLKSSFSYSAETAQHVAPSRPTLKFVEPIRPLEVIAGDRPIWYYFVPRMPKSYKFPVYEAVRSGGTRRITIIKFIKGSVPVSAFTLFVVIFMRVLEIASRVKRLFTRKYSGHYAL